MKSNSESKPKSNPKGNPLNKLFIIGGVIVAAEVLLGFLFLGVFAKKNRSIFSNIVLTEYNREIKENATEISNRFNDIRDYMVLSSQVADGDREVLKSEDYLSVITKTTESFRTVYVDENGIAYDDVGNVNDISQTDYYKSTRRKEFRVAFTMDDGFNNTPAFVVACKPNPDVNEYLLAFVSPNVFSDAVSKGTFYSYSFYVILDENYYTLAQTGRTSNQPLLEGKFWANLQNIAPTQKVWADFQDKVKKNNQANLLVTSEKKKRYIGFYAIRGTDMSLVVACDKAIIDRNTQNYVDPTQAMHAEMVFCLIAFIATYFAIIILYRVHSNEKSKALTSKAETDLLTGVNNKLSTESKIEDYIMANPGGQGVLILIDVDNFKKINDKMGHAFGDEVLRNLGMRLKSLYRASDIIGRIGGDEFIVFLKDISDMDVIEREARKLELFFQSFEVGEYTRYSVTASLGAAIYSIDGSSFEELYKNADKALYFVKQHGKKQLVFYKQDQKFNKKEEEE